LRSHARIATRHRHADLLLEPFFPTKSDVFAAQTKWGLRYIAVRQFEMRDVGTFTVHMLEIEGTIDLRRVVSEYCTAEAEGTPGADTRSTTILKPQTGAGFAVETAVTTGKGTIHVAHRCFTNGKAIVHARASYIDTPYAKRAAARFLDGIRVVRN